jgi:hypothetical protein
VENNILVNNGYHPHVWYADSADVFRRNIVWTDYQPAHMPSRRGARKWISTSMHDINSVTNAPAKRLQQQADATQIPSWRTHSSLIPRAAIIA